MTRVYYNENDSYCAEWLRNLVMAGELPAGDVDERSIVDVGAGDIAGYTSCHFFAGIGGWPYAARLAGWPDERPLWTGSCPCQPFSEAGQKGGRDDPRHLWPHFHRLISAGWPAVIMGEQVASPLGRDWFDGVCADLEGDFYACRAVDIPACAVDAPHERNRLYWIAVANGGYGRWGRQLPVGGSAGRDLLGTGFDPQAGHGTVADAQSGERWPGLCEAGPFEDGTFVADRHVAMGYAASAGQQGFADPRRIAGYPAGRPDAERADGRDGRSGDVVDPSIVGWDQGFTGTGVLGGRSAAAGADARDLGRLADADGAGQLEQGGYLGESRGRLGDQDGLRPNGSWWSDHEWITCHDGKSRRSHPGISLLAPRLPQGMAFGSATAPYHPSQERVAKWRGFGNAINAQLAKEVIAAFLDSEAASG